MLGAKSNLEAARAERRKRAEAAIRNRERGMRLQNAVSEKSDEALIEEALANGRVNKCQTGATSEPKSESES